MSMVKYKIFTVIWLHFIGLLTSGFTEKSRRQSTYMFITLELFCRIATAADAPRVGNMS